MPGKSTPDTSAADGRAAGPVLHAPAELASLIRSLDRPQDQHLFSKDVLLSYPQLAAAYTKVCPRRCDLATAARSAMEGKYSAEADLALLKSDLQLMVNNCVRFNGPDHPLSAVAQDFERFAFDKVQRFLEGKAGGRRPSSLRIQQSASPASGPASSLQQQHQQLQQHQRQKANASTGSVNTRRGEAEASLAAKDVAQLVGSLIRREDEDAFVVDVAETYPELREAYEATCPQKMNLRMMKARAQQGVYTTAPPAPVGTTIAECLPLLRDDVELVVGNCIRFNAQVDAWVSLARRFQSFAHRRIDDFVLSRLPHLRGTLTGADAFTTPTTAATLPVAGKAQATGGSAVTVTMVDLMPDAKRVRTEGPAAGGARDTVVQKLSPSSGAQSHLRQQFSSSPATRVRVTKEVSPSVRLMPVQPELTVPPPLRSRIMADYLARHQTPLRMVGAALPLAELVPLPTPPPLLTSYNDDNDALAPTTDDAGASTQPCAHGKDAEQSKSTEESVKTQTASTSPVSATACGTQGGSCGPPLVTITPAMSAESVLRAFRSSVSAFFDKQRSRIDVNNVFGFTEHEEQCYLRIVDTIAAAFESLLPRALLYEAELTDLLQYVGTLTLRRTSVATVTHIRSGSVAATTNAAAAAAPAVGGATDDAADGGDSLTAGRLPCRWAAKVHYTYLVRLLVQFPQMASLCVSCVEGEGGARRAGGQRLHALAARHSASGRCAESLRITKDALTAMQYVTKVVQEFLVFVADYEETALREARGHTA